MTSGPLRDHVLELGDEVAAWIGNDGHDAWSQTRDHLLEPLRVAVVGRVKAGKSTT